MDTTRKMYCLKYDYSDDGDEKLTFAKLQSTFNNTTTIHGIPHTAKAKGSLKKVVWAVFTLGCVAAFIYNLYAITNTFLSYQVYVKIDLHHSRKMTFPAVTICNTNPVKKSALHQSSRLQSLIANWDSSSTGSTTKRRRRKRSTCANALEPISGTCFWVENDSTRRTYAVAETACNNAGGKIAIVDTPEKKSHLFDTMGLGSKSMWINLAYNSGSNNWIWDGTTPISWTDWKSDPGTPPTTSTHTCAYISSISNSNHEWSNTGCDGVDSWGSLYGLYTLCQTGGSIAATTVEPTTIQETTLPDTTIAPTTIPETTEKPTTIPDTTIVPTTIPETTEEPTTIPDTTVVPTTIPETTVEPTTIQETTEKPTTIPETTMEPTTIAGTTLPQTTPLMTTIIGTTVQDTTTFPLTQMETTTLKILSTSTTQSSTTSTTVSTTTTTFKSVFPDRDPPREDFQKENDVMEILAELPDDIRKDMGYNYPEFVLECLYNNKECYEWEFDHFFDAVYGNCYVFNAGWNNSLPLVISTEPGRKYGLQLYVNLGQNEYMQSVSESAGAVVVVHNQLKMPFPEDEGVFAPPGRLTSIGSRRVAVERLGGDYSNCTQENNQEINVFHEQYGVTYSVNACEKTCYQKNVIDTCQCADPQYPITGKAFGNENHPSCDARNSTQADCLYGVTLKYIKDELDCNCPLPCVDTLYTYSASKLEWPSQNEKYALLQRYQDKISATLTPSTMEQYFKKNLLKVEVYLEEISFESMQELPKYPLLRFFSDIGAIIGLYMGCSILTVLEFLELGIDSLVLVIFKIIHYKNHEKDGERKRIIATTHKTKITPLNLREKTINSLRDIELKTSGNNSPTSLTGSTSTNSRRITTTHGRPRRGSIFDIFNKESIEQMYKVPIASCSNGDEGYGSSDSSPSLKRHRNTDKNGRWKPLHVALHEKFLFGDKNFLNSNKS